MIGREVGIFGFEGDRVSTSSAPVRSFLVYLILVGLFACC